MNCLWCDQEIIIEMDWTNVIKLPKPKPLCDPCDHKLKLLKGDRCERCSRITSDKVCSDCNWWMGQAHADPLIFNYSVYKYNEQMQAMIAKWKYRGDFILAHAFKQQFIQSFHRKFSGLKEDVIAIPIPLSEKRLYERGFNQAKLLAAFLPIEHQESITRIHSEKQSKMSRSERIATKNPFKMDGEINKSVILVDDIYTTGSTIRHAAALLKGQGCPKVYAFTLIRG